MRLLSIATALSLAATPALSDGVFGIWKSAEAENGAYIHVEIKSCADPAKVCGTIVKQFSPSATRSSVGRSIIKDMSSDGENEWAGGTIWAPDDDKTYSAEMHLKSQNVLEVSGCILGGIICRGQDWTRVK